MFWWLVRKVLGRLATREARRWAQEFEAATHRPREVQDALLARILETQRPTRFGREHHFEEIRTLADFRRRLPIRRYEEYEPYIAAMRRGEFAALVSDPVVHMFAMTSGTTASRKYIPVTPQYLADYRRGWTVWGLRAFEAHPQAKFRAILQLVSDWDEFRTEAGVPCGSVSGLTAQMQKRVVRWLYCMPAITGKIKDPTAKYYTALRLSLVRAVGMITSANPSTLVQLARLCDQEKESLIRDIRDGTLADRFAVPAEVRTALAPKLRKHPRRARELEEIVRRTGTLYPKDVWPDLQVIGNWTGGTVGAYLRHYPRYYGSKPVRDLGLIASEGRMTIPLEDGTASGVLDVTSHFFEFVPQDEMDRPQPTVLRADEVEEGKTYFILPTTAFGLYRYNIYDLVRVTGFHNRTPLVEFLSKGAHFANLTGEKLSEFQVVGAVQAALRELDATLTAYTVAPCWDDATPAYGLFVERGDLGEVEQYRELAAAVDRHLRRLNIEYDAKRASQRLGPLRVLLLPSGAWAAWDRRRLLQTGGSAEQYKHPCLVADLAFREQVPVEAELAPDPRQPVAP
jgi:hypothetical protein